MKKVDLEFHVLDYLAQEDDPLKRYGYCIWKNLLSIRHMPVKDKDVYNVLSRLEDRSLIEVTETMQTRQYSRTRKECWSLTEAGQEYYRKTRVEWKKIRDRLVYFLGDGQGQSE
jgi:DNA-binding PadR family transcriptional regulator